MMDMFSPDVQRWVILGIGTLNLMLVVAAIFKAYELARLFKRTNEAFAFIREINTNLNAGLQNQVEAMRTATNTQNTLLELKVDLKAAVDTIVHSINLIGEELDRFANLVTKPEPPK